jgi:hypothetical protein
VFFDRASMVDNSHGAPFWHLKRQDGGETRTLDFASATTLTVRRSSLGEDRAVRRYHSNVHMTSQFSPLERSLAKLS